MASQIALFGYDFKAAAQIAGLRNVKQSSVLTFPFVFFDNAKAARFHRQTAPQGHTGNVAAIQGSVPYTYAGAVRADKCHSRNSRSGRCV